MKRGSLLSLEALVNISIVAGFLILFFLILSPIIFGLFSTKSEDESAQENFGQMIQLFQEMMEEDSVYNTDTMIYNLPRGYAIVGFDTNEDMVIVPGNPSDKTVFKPTECYDNACICLYSRSPKNEIGEKDEGLVFCDNFAEDIYGEVVVLGYMKLGSNMPRGATRDIKLHPNDEFEPQYLYLLNTGVGYSDFSFNDLQQYYLEKVVKDNKTFLLFTPFVEDVQDRSSLFQLCPEHSEKACPGKPYDHVERNTDELYYCHYIESNGYCSAIDTVNCYGVSGQTCACADVLMVGSKKCFGGEIYDIDCNLVQTCADYCVSKTQCLMTERDLCEKDVCDVVPEGTCRIRGSEIAVLCTA